MGVTTAECFVCGQGTTVQFLPSRPSRRNLLGEWRKKWSMSLCHVLQLSDSFQSIFNEASFCFNCQEAVCRAEFTVNAISRLQNEIGVIREELKGNFQLHYENLMQGRTELDATGNEYKRMENIINQIAIKMEPIEQNVGHVLDNLEENEIIIPGIDLMHENEFPNVDLVDPLKNSNENESLTTATPQWIEDYRGKRRDESRKQSFRGKNAVKMDFFSATDTYDQSKNTSLPGTTKLNLTCNHESCRGHNLEFKLRREVREHILNRHDGLDVDKLFHCPQCPAQYKQLSTLRTHINSVHFTESLSRLVLPNHKWVLNCSICLKGFDEESKLKEHEILHVSATSHACVLCSEQNLKSAAHLRRHVQSAHDGKKYWCNMEPCLSSFVAFSRPREMKSHFTSEHSEEDSQRIYHCTECPSRFTASNCLVEHSQTHNTEQSYLCVICGKTFGTEQGMKRHASTFHTELEMKPKCSHCTKSFDGVAEMEEHESLHSKETPFTCVLCDKVLSCTTELQRHVANCHEIWEFECPVEGCDAKFPTKPRLKWHHRTSHGGVTKRFECPHCPARFYAPSALKRHMFGHTGEKPHSCPIAGCGRKFINKSKLNKHIQTLHKPVPEKQFECRLCGKRFRDRERLSLHEVTHGDARPFMCDVCPTTCKTRRNLNSHMKIHRKKSGTILKKTPQIRVKPRM